MNDITLILPYYNQPEMLKRQLEFIAHYPKDFKVIVVDDGSADRADFHVAHWNENLAVYRILEDIPWNRNGARNLGAFMAQTKWIIQTDIDHVLPGTDAEDLQSLTLDPNQWYRFCRVRVGKADETRKKDLIDPNAGYGEIKPHIDSYLITRERFLSSPYDERYRGFLGGGSPFLSRMKRLYGEAALLPNNVSLWVHTRHSVPDSSTQNLSRDPTQYKEMRRKIEASGDDTPIKPLNFAWERVL